MLRPFVLLAAAVLASPALYDAFVDGTLPVDQALVRYLIAVVVCAVGAGLLNWLVTGLGGAEGDVVGGPRRRREDGADRASGSGAQG